MRFGSYEIIERLAFGGMAEVFLASWERLSARRLVVIKRILPHLSADPDFVRMFLDEVRISARLDHPNIVHIYDAGEWEGSPYLVMEYVRGVTLKECLEQEGALTLAEAVGIAIELCKALHYAHTQKDPIIHRDVTPQNILLGGEGYVKLADFGIARVQDRITHTQAGVLKGKLAYMAPELLEGKEPSPLTDQYALGLVCFEMLTGARAYPRASELELLSRIRANAWQREHPHYRKLPAPLRGIVERALERDPGKRFPDCRSMLRALQMFYSRTIPDPWEELLAFRVQRILIAKGKGGEEQAQGATQPLPLSSATVEPKPLGKASSGAREGGREEAFPPWQEGEAPPPALEPTRTLAQVPQEGAPLRIEARAGEDQGTPQPPLKKERTRGMALKEELADSPAPQGTPAPPPPGSGGLEGASLAPEERLPPLPLPPSPIPLRGKKGSRLREARSPRRSPLLLGLMVLLLAGGIALLFPIARSGKKPQGALEPTPSGKRVPSDTPGSQPLTVATRTPSPEPSGGTSREQGGSLPLPSPSGEEGSGVLPAAPTLKDPAPKKEGRGVENGGRLSRKVQGKVWSPTLPPFKAKEQAGSPEEQGGSSPLSATAPGYLSIQVLPWAFVAVGGEVQRTPLIRKPLAPGRYEVRLRNPPLNWELVTTVTIRAEQETRMIFDAQGGSP